MHIIGWIIFGLVVGIIARFLMPGNQSMGMITTILLGVAGSFLGGMIANLTQGGSSPTAEPSAGSVPSWVPFCCCSFTEWSPRAKPDAGDSRPGASSIFVVSRERAPRLGVVMLAGFFTSPSARGRELSSGCGASVAPKGEAIHLGLLTTTGRPVESRSLLLDEQ